MKCKKLHIFRNIIANLIIFAVIGALTFFAFYGVDYDFSVTASSNGAYYYGNREEEKVSLMFNVYSGEEYLEAILNTLKAYDARSTFFIGGVWVEKHPESLKLIAASGMEIGNHGYLHRDSDKLSRENLTHEIKATENIIYTYTSKKTSLFAPPSGAVDNDAVKVAASLDYHTIMWSKDTIDWRDQDSNKIFVRATQNIKNGDLILMHPTKSTLEALPKILDNIIGQGYLVTTVSDCLSLSIA